MSLPKGASPAPKNRKTLLSDACKASEFIPDPAICNPCDAVGSCRYLNEFLEARWREEKLAKEKEKDAMRSLRKKDNIQSETV